MKKPKKAYIIKYKEDIDLFDPDIYAKSGADSTALKFIEKVASGIVSLRELIKKECGLTIKEKDVHLLIDSKEDGKSVTALVCYVEVPNLNYDKQIKDYETFLFLRRKSVESNSSKALSEINSVLGVNNESSAEKLAKIINIASSCY